MRRAVQKAVLAAMLSLGAFGLAPLPLAAQTLETEREALGRLDNELGVLERLVYDAEQRARSGDRVLFDYRALRADLQGIRHGLRSYIDNTRPQPHAPEPLSEQYVRVDAGPERR